MDARSCIDLIHVQEDGSPLWVGRVGRREEAQAKLNELSLASDDAFLAVDKSTRMVVAHVVGKAVLAG